MKKKLTVLNSIILILSLGTVFSVGILFARNALLNEAEDNVISLTEAYTEGFDGTTDNLTAAKEDDNVRETILESDGTVLWDSEEDASTMENHASREEVQAALEGSPKVVTRSSATMGTEQIYYALTKEIDSSTYVIRVSYTTSGLTQFLTGYIPWMVVVTLVALSLSIVATTVLSNRALEPLEKISTNLEDVSKGRVPAPLHDKDPDIQKIENGINEVSLSLSDTMEELRKEKETLELVLDSASDAIVAVNKENEIVFTNKAFKNLYPMISKKLPKDLSELFSKKTDRFVLKGVPYLVHVSNNESLSLLVLTDITAQVEGEKQRQEFFDASSHELKTPLTAIRGFNELILLKEQDPELKGYAEKVETESNRMLKVLTDMLKISSLENEQPEENLPPVDLALVTDEVFKELQPLANERKVTLSTEGNAEVCFKREDAYSLIKNLVENGILYNIQGGYVKVTLSSDSLIVEDNGVGISEKDQNRVFERFYRVDKSRSRANGGTGLGLSIVKHIAMKYHARLTLESRPGFGSKFTIYF